MKRKLSAIYAKNHWLCSICLGIAAGLFTVAFSQFPEDRVWGVPYFSSTTLGFWTFSASAITLRASKRHIAAIDVGLYIFAMWIVVGTGKSLVRVLKFYSDSLDLLYHVQESLMVALVCAGLSALLFFAQHNSRWGRLLRWIPLLYIAAETLVLLYVTLFVDGHLFVVFSDAVVGVIYFRNFIAPRARTACTRSR